METNKLTVEYIQFNGNIDAIRDFTGKECTKLATLETSIVVDLEWGRLVNKEDYILKFPSGIMGVVSKEDFEEMFKTD